MWLDEDPLTQHVIRYVTFQSTFDVSDGLITRTVEAELAVASQIDTTIQGNDLRIRQNRRALSKLNAITVVVPLGFSRQSASFRESSDMTKLNATWVDRQLPTTSPFPDYVTSMTFRHEVANDTPKAFAVWSGTMECSVTLAPGVHGAYAAKAFSVVARPRLVATIQNGPRPETLIPLRFSAADDPFSRTWTFRLQYTFTGTLAAIFAKAGFFKNTTEASGDGADVDRPSFVAWKTSMDSIWRNGGASNFSIGTTQPPDLKTLCTAEAIDNINDPLGSLPAIGWQSSLDYTLPVGSPSAAHSWMHYDQELKFNSDYGAIAGRPMIRKPSTPPTMDPDRNLLQAAADKFGLRDDSSGTEALVQSPSAPVHAVSLEGTALRFGYPIAAPDFREHGGAALSPADVEFRTRIVASVQGTPIYGAYWTAKWVALKTPVADDIAMPIGHVEQV